MCYKCTVILTNIGSIQWSDYPVDPTTNETVTAG